MVDFILKQMKIKKPYYVDIGANHPTRLNNTYKFYEKGSEGLLVEANPELARKLASKRPRDEIIANALEREGVSEVELHIMNSHEFSTTDRSQAAKPSEHRFFKVRETVVVPTISFPNICRRCCATPVDFVSLDIETNLMPLVSEIDFTKFRPKIWCVETKIYNPDGSNQRDWDLIDFFISQNYTVYADTFINTIFVERDWKGASGASIAARSLKAEETPH
ncbi:FkbM family methyltransferase [Rhodomicrobium sp. Az07]|uniref:FkbM family methyltransferase n=1 Tax=Rhodomicrobium sp. Az07 TaxID=2839034 RepID=UPI001BE5A029|nr:FkbM family methyltransferase [Rhodomicrobium sp. Az07]MBT3072160.1 FkbM family methyltransferase [Rhodomicrobium sp. Az07]